MSAAASDLAAGAALGLHIDLPPEQWPAVEEAAFIVVIGDRQRSGARKLLRRFLGRAGLRRVLSRLPGRWILIACGHAGFVSATDVDDQAALIDAHRDVLLLSRLVRGHVEVFHALDAQTRSAVLENGKAHALRLAPIGGRA